MEEESYYFLQNNRNKRSMTLNLRTEKGVEVLKTLVKDADVLVENYRPGVKKKLGIDYEEMKKGNPRLIYTSISGFGQTGPYANRPGFDPIAQGISGSMQRHRDKGIRSFQGGYRHRRCPGAEFLLRSVH